MSLFGFFELFFLSFFDLLETSHVRLPSGLSFRPSGSGLVLVFSLELVDFAFACSFGRQVTWPQSGPSCTLSGAVVIGIGVGSQRDTRQNRPDASFCTLFEVETAASSTKILEGFVVVALAVPIETQFPPGVPTERTV